MSSIEEIRCKLWGCKTVTTICSKITPKNLNTLMNSFDIKLDEEIKKFDSEALRVHNYLFHRRCSPEKTGLYYRWNGVFLETLLFRLLIENGKVDVSTVNNPRYPNFFNPQIPSYEIFDEIYLFSYRKMTKGTENSLDDEDLRYIRESSTSPEHFRKELCQDLTKEIIPLFGNNFIYDVKLSHCGLTGIPDFMTPKSIIEIKVAATDQTKFLTQLIFYYALLKKNYPTIEIENLILVNMRDMYISTYSVKSFSKIDELFEMIYSTVWEPPRKNWMARIWERTKNILCCRWRK